MNNIILKTTLSLIWKLIFIYSIYILLRGHNDPGGGFIGGLLLALSFIIRGHILQNHRFEEALVRSFPRVLGILLLGLLTTILLPGFFGEPLFKGLWTSLWIPITGKFSSVLVFDMIVYLMVSASGLYAHWVLVVEQSRGPL